MATYTVVASADDSRMSSIANDAGRAPTASGTCSITEVILSPGSHGSNDEWSVAARFTSIAVANAATISSATFSMKAQTTYASGGTIAYLVSAQAADNAGTLTTAAGNLNTTARPRTTAVSGTWTQTSTVAGTRYSIDVTSVIQEIVNRAGWASGNAIVMLVDTATATTVGEWTDYYAWDDTTDRTNNPPQLEIVTSGATAPTYVAAGTLAATITNGGTMAPGMPAGTAADDIAVLVVHESANVDISDTISGWIKITPGGVAENNTAAMRVECWCRRLTGSGDAPTVPGIADTNIRTARIFAVRGCATTGTADSVILANRSNNAASTTVTFPTCDAGSNASTLSVLAYTYVTDPSAATTPSGFSAFSVLTTTTGADSATGMGATRTNSGSGTLTGGTSTVSTGTFSSSVNVGLHFVFLPPSTTATGTAAVTLPALTASGTGTHTAPVYTATSDVSLVALTAAGSGTFTDAVPPVGTSTANLPAMTASGTGTHTAPVYTGTSAPTLAALTVTASGTFTAPVYSATAADTLPALTATGTGTHTAPVYTATAGVTAPPLTTSGTGTHTAPVYSATAADTLPPLTASGTGTWSAAAPYTGTSAPSLPALTASGTGTFSAAVVITGTATVNLPTMTASGTGTQAAPVYTATAAHSLPSLTVTSSGTFTAPVYSATAATTLPPLTASGAGTVAAPVYSGAGATLLPVLTLAGVGTSAAGALVPILAPVGTWDGDRAGDWATATVVGGWTGGRQGTLAGSGRRGAWRGGKRGGWE